MHSKGGPAEGGRDEMEWVGGEKGGEGARSSAPWRQTRALSLSLTLTRCPPHYHSPPAFFPPALPFLSFSLFLLLPLKRSRELAASAGRTVGHVAARLPSAHHSAYAPHLTAYYYQRRLQSLLLMCRLPRTHFRRRRRRRRRRRQSGCGCWRLRGGWHGGR